MNFFGDPSPRLFALKVLLPLLLAVAALVTGTTTAILWIGGQSDRISIERQQRLTDLVVSQLQSGVAHDQESATVWDDAVVKVRAGDQEWIDANLGEWMHAYFGHDAAFILDPVNQAAYSYYDGSQQSATAFSNFTAVISPLAEELRRRLRSGDTDGVSGQVLTIGVSDIVTIAGRPAIASVKPIVSDTGEIEQAAGSEYLHIALRFLDGEFIARLANEYQLNGARFAPQTTLASGEASSALLNRAGQLVGYLAWQPYRPGSTVIKQAFPLLVGFGLITMIGALALLVSLRRRSLVLRKREAEVRYLASHDTLTGLSNRHTFEKRLDQALRTAGTSSERLAVLYLDLDHFKKVNDTYGHPAGDRLLQEFGDRLARCCRSSDIISRLGGDEFGILLRHMGSDDDLRQVCMKIIETARHPFDVSDTQAFIGVSIGAAYAESAQANSVELAKRADIAMYHAKRSGRSGYAVFHPLMNHAADERKLLEDDLRKTLAAQGLTLNFQPLYAAQSAEMTGVEVLVRWNHPARGAISPAEFVPLAEECGLIEQLGAWVLDKAIKSASAWPLKTIAVNVSAVELANPTYALRVTKILSEQNFDPRRLELELTETAFDTDAKTSDRNIELLRQIGVRFALDDFGVGFSSLGRLHKFDVDRIKIDRSFVNGFGVHSGDEAIVEAIVNLARAAGLKTTAEGVETVEQAQYLKSIGCDELQGFLLSKPLTAAGIEKLLTVSGLAATA